jgi:hypothetical protein
LPALTRRAGCASRSRSRWVTPSRWRYLTAWYASASGDCAAYQRPTARRSERPQPRKPSTNVANWNRCVPVRATCGSASSAALRVASSAEPRRARARRAPGRSSARGPRR